MASQSGISRFKSALIGLLPTGKLWRPEEQPIFDDLIESLAVEPCRVQDRADQLINIEFDPRIADETLDRWESTWGLPDECTPEGQSKAERQQQLVQKITVENTLSIPFLESTTLALGFASVITNRVAALVGRARVGDALYNGFERRAEAGKTVGTRHYETGWTHVFNVELPASAAEVAEVGDVVGTALREFSNPLIECTINKLLAA